jgi:hypothetical protein
MTVANLFCPCRRQYIVQLRLKFYILRLLNPSRLYHKVYFCWSTAFFIRHSPGRLRRRQRRVNLGDGGSPTPARPEISKRNLRFRDRCRNRNRKRQQSRLRFSKSKFHTRRNSPASSSCRIIPHLN